ncbi:MAG: protein kinase [Gemmatimonadales bacterium]|nr:protein kinase [Gemmatimonadales bacterium]
MYLAQDLKHDRRVAIKVLDPEYGRAVGTQRFVREIRIAARLTHPNIVPLYDSGEIAGQLFYVMPYVEGENLRGRLKRETMLPVAQVLEWAAEIADGLAFAHAQGIVHRDIKPENLLIQSGHVLIADFGIARAIDLAAGENITSEQLVLGTPMYMSPEQAGGGKLDGRTDVYSLGCVVYEMLTGEPPFGGRTPQAITAKKLSGRYPGVRVIRPTIPQAVDHALARALAVIPADRFASAEEFSRSLRVAAKPKSGRLLLWLAGVGLIGAAIAVVATHSAPTQVHSAVRPRVVVGIFENRSGDPSYDPLGFMAADWVTEGLQRTGTVDVVPTLTALTAARFLREEAGTEDPVRALARETGASLVVTGAIYRDQDSLLVQAQLANAKAGRLVGAVEPIWTDEKQPAQALQQLRARLMGLLALSLDDRVIQAERPPTYAAYQAFSEGMDAYVREDYGPALAAFEGARAADTTFVLPLLYASFCYMNSRNYAVADSVLRIVASQRDRLSKYDRYWLDYQKAELAGNASEALAAIRHAAELAPTSKATYNFAAVAFEAREPFPAESALRRLSPDVGPMRGWFPYWDLLSSALHVQGKHRLELEAAREARRRFPDRITAYLPEARALAAKHESTELEHLWSAAAGKINANSTEIGTLAYEVGSELFAHEDSSDSQPWFTRAYKAFATGDEITDTHEGRWGRARAAARLGRLREAFDLGEALAAADSTRLDYVGFVGVLASQLGNQMRAEELLHKLAADRRSFTLGEPRFQAGRIAAALGDLERATELLASAQREGYAYEMDFHRDEILARLRGLPILRQLDAHDK